MKNRLLRLFNIRNDEAWLVTNLFWLQFFQGAGVAIFNTAAFAFFLQRYEVTKLPQVYLFSAVLLWITGFLYTKVEHHFAIKKLVPVIIVFIAVSIIAFRIQSSLIDGAWFIFLMFSWYYVIYLLSNLEFWGLASLQFDIRQSKRLFGMIGAGDIPAKLLGYSAVPFLEPLIGNNNMLIISAGLILCALFFYFRLRNAGKMEMHIKHEHHGHHHSGTNPTVRDMLRSFFGNRMIAMVALLSFIVVTCVTVISFSFYSEIKHEAHSDEQLASFIAMFYAGGRLLAIVVRLIFTGRITNIIGTKGTLLISPILLFVFVVVIILLPFISVNKHAILYIFGLMAIVTEVLKTSLQDPVFLSLMQPLSTHLRLKGHTIVKGVMDPFALAFSGLMLYTLVAISHKVDLFLLSYMLVTLLVVWVVLIFLVDREYLRTLVNALDKRYSVGQEIDLTDARTMQTLDSKIGTVERGEAIYILNLLEKNYSEEMESLVLKAMQHPQLEVRTEAIKLAERKKILAALPVIDGFINAKEDSRLLPEAVKAKCMLQPDELQNFDEFLNQDDPRLVKAAITGFMASGGISAVVTAGQKLLYLIASAHADERRMAAEIIGELGVQSFYKPLFDLMHDPDPGVVKAAIDASGKIRNQRLIPTLVQFFVARKHEKQIIEALYGSGDLALHEVEKVLLHQKLNRKQQSQLILLLGRIGTDHASQILDELVWRMPEIRTDVFHALHLCEFKPHHHSRQKHLELINQYLNAATRILFMTEAMGNQKTTRVLADALLLELDEIRNSLLLLFSFVYNREKMIKAKNAFQFKRQEAIANALEIIEIEVPKDVSLRFIALFDSNNVEERCHALRPSFKETLDYEAVIDDVLNDSHYYYHRWTKAAALYSVIFNKGQRKAAWLEKARRESDVLLNETAIKILAEMPHHS